MELLLGQELDVSITSDKMVAARNGTPKIYQGSSSAFLTWILSSCNKDQPCDSLTLKTSHDKYL